MPYLFVAVLVLLLGAFAFLAPRVRSAEPPEPPSAPRAMCYKPRPARMTNDFVCPKDGSRTQFPLDGPLAARVRELPRLQASASALATPEVAARATIALDLSELCRACTPKPPATPKPVLSVKLPNGKQTRTRGITHEDLVILAAFFAGSTQYQTEGGKTAPLSLALPRIRKLLGMPNAKLHQAGSETAAPSR
jgi:hypothetical protein